MLEQLIKIANEGEQRMLAGLLRRLADSLEADADRQQARKKQRVGSWLAARFREKRQWASGELLEAAHEAGIGRTSVFDTKRRLPIQAVQVTGEDGRIRRWEWQAVPGWPKSKADA